MKFYQHQDSEDFGIDIAPLIDVVFLLLIFFMVTTSFNHKAALKIVLPRAHANLATRSQHPITLSIDRKGHYYLDGRELINTRPVTLYRALEQLKASTGNKSPLIVRADANTPYQAVVTAMSVAGEVGLVHLSIAVNPIGKHPDER